MGLRARIARIAKGRVAPALLVLLLGGRVATAAAVACQHELADAARAAERAQETRLAEVVALGGALCLYAVGAPSDTAGQADGPHLSTPCPFFKSPVALTDAAPDPVARIVVFSRLAPLTDAACPEAQAVVVVYSARAPPIRG